MKNTLITQGKVLLLSAVLIGSSLTTLSVSAADNGYNNEQVKMQKKKGKHHKKQFRKMAKLLELTEEQKTEIKAIYKEAKAEKLANKEAMKAFKEAVKPLAEMEDFDEQTFLDTFNSHSNAFAQQALVGLKKHHAIHKVLTEEQRIKWKAYKAGQRSNR